MRAAGTAARVTRPPRPTRRPLPRARPAGFPPVEPVKAGEAQPAAASKASKTQALRESMKEVRPRWRPPCKLVGRTPPSAAMRAANPDCQRQPKSLASPPPHQPPPHGPSPPLPPPPPPPRQVLTSWRTWLLALTYFMVYLVRQGCTSWLIFYLLEAKGAANAAAAALTVSGAGPKGRPEGRGSTSGVAPRRPKRLRTSSGAAAARPCLLHVDTTPRRTARRPRARRPAGRHAVGCAVGRVHQGRQSLGRGPGAPGAT
jgi:hypothetical protein